MPPDTTSKPHIPGGVSEPCLFNEHGACTAPNCSCSCHKPAANPNIPTIEVGPENACPTCGIKRPATESYCRIDGTRLTSLACNMCGRGMNPEDSYCFNCGAPKGAANQPKPKVVTVPAIDTNYEQQVLRGLQEELSVQPNGNEVPSTTRTQTVVEQPMGEQGSFKLVSSPSPNRIRSPQSSGRIRLPLKPG